MHPGPGRASSSIEATSTRMASSGTPLHGLDPGRRLAGGGAQGRSRTWPVAGSPRCGRNTIGSVSTRPPTTPQRREAIRLEKLDRVPYICTRASSPRPRRGWGGSWSPAGSRRFPPISRPRCMSCWASPRCGGVRSRTAWTVSARRAASSRSARGLPRQPAGSREAIQQFTAYLEHEPGDLRVRWLLNLAYMTLGEYPREGPAGVPDPARSLPLEARKWAGSKTSPSGPAWGPGARTWPAAASSTISTATTCPTCSRRRSMPTSGPPCSSTEAMARSRIVPPRPASASRSMPSTSPAPTTTTTATPTSCCCGAPGRSRPGSRCCGTRGTGASRT